MKVKVTIEVDIDEKQYDDTYCDYYHRIDRSTMELIKTPQSTKQMLDDMKTDITANAQSGILQWAERLHFDIKIKDNIVA
tara:strand:+ start:2024 stop:2263 length:240 start_codon:yes stop_codon:yes gene_type:complete